MTTQLNWVSVSILHSGACNVMYESIHFWMDTVS